MKKTILGFLTLSCFMTSAYGATSNFNLTYNSENPFYQPREGEFYSKTQLEYGQTSINLQNGVDINGAMSNLRRDVSSNNIFINEKVGYGLTRRWDLFVAAGYVMTDLKWDDINSGDYVEADDKDLNFINVGASYFVTRTKNFSLKVEGDLAIAPKNDVAGYGNKVNAKIVAGKEWENAILAFHLGGTYNLKADEKINYFGLKDMNLEIPSSFDYYVGAEGMYGFNKYISVNGLIKYDFINKESEQNINFLNGADARGDIDDGVFTFAGQINYSITKNILAAAYIGHSMHTVKNYATIDPFLASGIIPSDISQLAPAFMEFKVKDFSNTYMGLKFNIIF